MSWVSVTSLPLKEAHCFVLSSHFKGYMLKQFVETKINSGSMSVTDGMIEQMRNAGLAKTGTGVCNGKFQSSDSLCSLLRTDLYRNETTRCSTNSECISEISTFTKNSTTKVFEDMKKPDSINLY